MSEQNHKYLISDSLGYLLIFRFCTFMASRSKTAPKKTAKSFEDNEEEAVGRVYEYFLGKFAASEGKLGGEWSGATSTTRQGCPEGERGGAHQFYTSKCVVNLIAEMIEPNNGKIYATCCQNGSLEKDWCGTPFYWPVTRAYQNALTAIFTVDILN